VPQGGTDYVSSDPAETSYEMRSLSKMIAGTMNVEDDDLETLKISKSRRLSSKIAEKRRRLSSAQKTTMEKITIFFLEMSLKEVMTEILRILDATHEAQQVTTTMKGEL